MASTNLLAPAGLGFRVRRRGWPSISVRICQVAVVGGSPRQLTLSQSSQFEHWCGRQTAEHPDLRLSACYVPGASAVKRKYLDSNTAASGYSCGQRTSTRGTHNTSWGGWAAYIAGLSSWRRDHFPIQEGTQHTHPLSNFLPDLVDVRRPVECVSRVTPR